MDGRTTKSREPQVPINKNHVSWLTPEFQAGSSNNIGAMLKDGIELCNHFESSKAWEQLLDPD